MATTGVTTQAHDDTDEHHEGSIIPHNNPRKVVSTDRSVSTHTSEKTRPDTGEGGEQGVDFSKDPCHERSATTSDIESHPAANPQIGCITIRSRATNTPFWLLFQILVTRLSRRAKTAAAKGFGAGCRTVRPADVAG